MLLTLGVAENTGGSDSALSLPLVCIGIIVVIGVLAVVPLLIGALRRHRHAEALLAMTVLWGAIAMGLAIVTMLEQNKWSSERQTRINTGYYDPNDNSQAPPLPIKSGGALAIGYIALLIWAAAAPRKPSVMSAPEPEA